MKLKTFRAASMAEALSLVKKDLGRDAVILHTRSLRVGGFLGIGRKAVVEITAADEPVPTARRTRQAVQADATVPGAARGAVASPGTRAPGGGGGAAGFVQDSEGVATRLMTAAPGVAARAYRQNAGEARAGGPGRGEASAAVPVFAPTSPFAKPSVPPSEPSAECEARLMPVRGRRSSEATQATGTKSPFASADGVTSSAIQRELADIKLLVNQVLQGAPAAGAGVLGGQMPEALFDQYMRLLESAVSRDIADAVVGAVRDELTPGELADADIVRTTVLRHLSGLIPVADAAPPAPEQSGPLVIALVGPTGVGKTTTIAKLAAAYKLRHGRSVGLITADTYRIAAVDQLRTYAGIIGIPLKVVLSPAEMSAAVQSLSNHDVVLIDTAGRSQFNTDRIDELGEFLSAAGPDQVHLVLAMTASEQVLLKTAAAFAPARPNRVIFTKLDEAVNFGVVVNVARRLTAKLSFVTTGQEVPDQIEAGHPERLARMVLDNGIVSTHASRKSGERPAIGEAELVGSGRRQGGGQ